MSHEFSENPAAQSAEMPGDDNPYASPQAAGPLLAKDEVTEPVGIWRAGNVLIMHRDAALPPRCVVTNALCDETELRELVLDSRRTILFAQAIIALLGAVLSLGFFLSRVPDRHLPAAGTATLAVLLIALFTLRKPVEFNFRYGIKHSIQVRRLVYRNVGAFVAVTGLLVCIAPAGIVQFSSRLAIAVFGVGLCMMSGGAIAYLAGRFPLRIERPNGNYLVIHGAGGLFLANFPEATIGVPFLGHFFPKLIR